MTVGDIRSLLSLAALGGLSACSQSGDDGPPIVTEEQVADRLAAAAPHLPQPGDYELAILQDGTPSEVRGCLSAAQLSDPLQALVTGGRSDCAFSNFTFKGPALDANMVCTSDDGPQSISLSATYRPDGYDLDMRVGTGDNVRQVEMKARRLGPCADTEDTINQGSN